MKRLAWVALVTALAGWLASIVGGTAGPVQVYADGGGP